MGNPICFYPKMVKGASTKDFCNRTSLFKFMGTMTLSSSLVALNWDCAYSANLLKSMT